MNRQAAQPDPRDLPHSYTDVVRPPIEHNQTSGVEKNVGSPRRQMGHRDGGISSSLRRRCGRVIMLVRPPMHEIGPKDYAVKDGKPWQMKPMTRRRIRHTGADGKFLGVQRLIETAFFHDRVQRNALQLPVGRVAVGLSGIGCTHSK